MKKIIALLLAITFIFTLCACSKGGTSSDLSSSIPAVSKGFVKPANYASVYPPLFKEQSIDKIC